MSTLSSLAKGNLKNNKSKSILIAFTIMLTTILLTSVGLTCLNWVKANKEITIERVEDEHFITISHSMSKDHYISFIAYLTTDRVQFVKFYPECNAETRLNFRGSGFLYIYCNKHGLMKQKI